MKPSQNYAAVLSIILLLSLVLKTVATPLMRQEVEDLAGFSQSLNQRQESPIVIAGIQAGKIYPRLEIRQLQKNTDQWNIYLLGLLRFQQTNQSLPTSYYQIAGIHGRPYAPWNAVQPASGNTSPGYCMHVLNLFLVWHRPFVALFEQTLYGHMVDVVNEFPAGAQRQRYASAISSWRLPYWDWAMQPPAGEGVLPASVQSPTISVTSPNGTHTIHNPLYSYQFHPVSKADFYYDPFASWNETMRDPTSWALNATSQNSKVASSLNNNRVSFQDRLYNLFVNYNNFTEFGNEAWMSSAGMRNADSLESLHDVIHSFVGSNGHMTYLDYSAFDPTFFLHHTMIDRIFAMWQDIYPKSYVEPMKAIEQTYTIHVNDTENIDSPLEPFFRDDGGDFWTATSARDIKTFGYTYPELQSSANASSVRAAVNRLYGSSAADSKISKRASSVEHHLQGIEEGKTSLHSDALAGGGISGVGAQRQYTANIRSQKFALNGSYAIYVFMGEFDDDPTNWSTDDNLVGTTAVFTGLAMVDASSNRQDSTIQVSGSVPLTSKLLAKAQAGELASMAPAVVETFLYHNLRWRVAMFDGTEVPLEDLPELRVVVVSALVEPATSADEFPKWSNFGQLEHATAGNTFGVGCEE